jgi:excinuclease ABC subunit A
MAFLPTTFVPCESCGGTRYAAHALQVRYKGASIADVLQMSMQEAAEHFAAIQSIAKSLTLACKMGLTYLQLGQGSHTLSGGEAQRLKIITELSKTRRKETLYVLDEPSTGLHLQDVAKLLAVLHELVDRGDTVVVIEHQLDLLAQADWLIDLGPGAGEAGGQVLWQGPVAGLLAGGSGPTRDALRSGLPTAANPK